MPPYMRDTPACVTMAFKWSRCSGKNVLSTSAPDAERQLWPEGYAGWLGFPTAATTVISGSACHGRMNQYVSFASQQCVPRLRPTLWRSAFPGTDPAEGLKAQAQTGSAAGVQQAVRARRRRSSPQG